VDLVNRRFVADRPDALWVTDITQHRTAEGWVYRAVVLDVYARRVMGWSIADHPQIRLVVGTLDMARRQRRPATGQTWSITTVIPPFNVTPAIRAEMAVVPWRHGCATAAAPRSICGEGSWKARSPPSKTWSGPSACGLT